MAFEDLMTMLAVNDIPLIYRAIRRIQFCQNGNMVSMIQLMYIHMPLNISDMLVVNDAVVFPDGNRYQLFCGNCPNVSAIGTVKESHGANMLEIQDTSQKPCHFSIPFI